MIWCGLSITLTVLTSLVIILFVMSVIIRKGVDLSDHSPHMEQVAFIAIYLLVLAMGWGFFGLQVDVKDKTTLIDYENAYSIAKTHSATVVEMEDGTMVTDNSAKIYNAKKIAVFRKDGYNIYKRCVRTRYLLKAVD